MGLGKQAKVLSQHQQNAMLNYLSTTRNPLRNQLIFQLSMKAGLRAKEIANLTWTMVTNVEGEINDKIALTNEATKGNSGGIVYMAKSLQDALKQLMKASHASGKYVIQSERSEHVSAQVIVNMFKCWYKKLGFDGCSSHSGRRTFITNAARKIGSVGGSIKDVQMLARHSSLQMTQLYVETDKEAMRKVVDLV
jgi:integrase/recombinase XerD